MKQVDQVPHFKYFAYPVLKFLSNNKNQSNKDVQKYIISFFNLSENAIESLTGGGSKTVLYSHTYWALTYLCKAKLVSSAKSETNKNLNLYSITTLGKKFLKEKGESITIKSLEGIPEFDEFQNKGKFVDNDPSDGSSQVSNDFTEKTPE